jgi:hypothetical protein
MNITKRIQQLEQVKVNDLALILLWDGDTEDKAYHRYCNENNKPRVVVFVSPFDMLL